jgi:hypothetical protein
MIVSLLPLLGVRLPLGELVASIGAVAALATLILVQQQISIARQQLDVARAEIKIVKDDLSYSKLQSEFTQAQVAELQRRPHLTVSFRDGTSVLVMNRILGRLMFSADVTFHNDGTRTATGMYAEALVPWHVLDHELNDIQIAHHAETEMVDGIAHRRFELQVNDPIYCDIGRVATLFTEPLVMDPPSFTIRWRLRDDYGAYPQDEAWGRLEVRMPTQDAAENRLRYIERWQGDLYPMLGWDRMGTDRFFYASLAPDAGEDVAIIDQVLQRKIEELVWSMPGLSGTQPNTTELGVEFLHGDPLGPLSGVNITEIHDAQQYERGRHRCYVRCDGAVEVRLPEEDGSRCLYELLRALGATYAIAMVLHSWLDTKPHAHGRLAYKIWPRPDLSIGSENESWIDIRLNRDTFVQTATSTIMQLQRAGRTPPIEAKTRAMIDDFWNSYSERIKFLIV